MRCSNHGLGRFKDKRLSLALLPVMLILLGTFLTPSESGAQAVPPRVQTMMINKPDVPPPIPPLQKEIEELKRDVKANKRELERRKQVEKTVESLQVLCPELRRQLWEEKQKRNPDKDVINGLLKQIRNCEQDLQQMRKLRY
jgi:hypothetical protein